MTNKQIVLCALAATLLITACKKSRRDLLIGSWQGIKIDNPANDAFYKESQHYIDTFGHGHSALVNYELYGVTNVDSLRREMQVKLDSTKLLQDRGLKNSEFIFNRDSMAIIALNGFVDTSKWRLQDDNNLEIEEIHGPTKGQKVLINIVAANDTNLVLKFAQDSAFSTVTFKRNKK